MNKKTEKRIRLKKKIRTKVVGTSERPRLSVFRSNQYIYAQIINDENNKTLVSVSDLPRLGKAGLPRLESGKAGLKVKTGTKTERAQTAGSELAKLAITKGIKLCVFDRNGFKYIGRIKALADSARVAGLNF
jgi:large subunit ribosomal protein L18